MDERTLKITNVLADPTRYSIYQYLYSIHRGVSVQEIADQFEIHPNVARLHLNKLEDVRLVQSKTEKANKGGRPGKVYVLSDVPVNIQFPPRDYQLLSDIAIETVLSMGKEGEAAMQKVAFKYGKEQALNAIYNEHLDIDAMNIEEKLPYILKLATSQGLNPEIEQLDEYALRFRVFNCTFKESAIHQPSICKMHHGLLSGMFSAFFGRIDLIEDSSMLQPHCSACEYTMVHLPS